MNCTWKGPKLRDILQEATLTIPDCKGQHAAFASFQPVQGADWYGGSVELERAMSVDADILLALEVYPCLENLDILGICLLRIDEWRATDR